MLSHIQVYNIFLTTDVSRYGEIFENIHYMYHPFISPNWAVPFEFQTPPVEDL